MNECKMMSAEDLINRNNKKNYTAKEFFIMIIEKGHGTWIMKQNETG